jgi:hypothetical protein
LRWLTNWLTDWLKELLVDGIMSNLHGLFENVQGQIGDVTTMVGTSPSAWHPGIFSLIRQLSETIILPIAGVILTFLATYELIQMIIDKNNLNEVDTWLFFKWVMKTFIAVLILANTFTAVMAIFDVSQSVVNQAGNLIGTNTAVTPDLMDTFRDELMEMDIGPLLGLWMQSFLVQITMIVLNIVVVVIVYGRMIEIFIMTSLAPIPFATLANREFGTMGQNYFKALCAIGLQGFLMLVCIAIYAILLQGIVTSGDPIGAIWLAIGYTVLLCFTLFKTGSVSKSIFGVH